MGSLGAKSLPPFITGSRGSRAGPNARQAPLRNGREHHTTSDAYRAWKTRGDASFSSIPGLNGFSHGAPERPENQEALPLWKPQFGVETSLPQPSGGQAHFPWKRPQCYLNWNRAHGQLRPNLGGGSLEQGHAEASLLQLPGPQGSKYMVPSQLLLAVVEESKGVQVCGNLSLYVYVSALTWRLGFVLSRGWVLRGPDSRTD